MESTDLPDFSEVARYHAGHPQNHGPLEDFNGHARITGPCGDTMEFWLAARNGEVRRVSFITDGRGSCLACGSIATGLVKGKRVEDAAALLEKDILDALAGSAEESGRCALLTANTLKAACEDCLKRRQGSTEQPFGTQAARDTNGDTDRFASERNKDETEQEFQERRQLQSRLCRIRHKVVVISGKGGVGKSTLAVNLAASLTMSGNSVGLLDVDIHGPSIPTMLGLERETVRGWDEGMLPVQLGNMKVMSLGFLVQNQDDAVMWRGPMKTGVIKQFLKDVVWGDLDYLIIDFPPGTGDEPFSVCKLIGRLRGAVVVTTPQKVAAVDVRKAIMFCRRLHVPVLGVVENMSGFACPKCGEVTQILRSGGGSRIAEDMGVPFLGSIPMDPRIAEACDSGRPFVQQYAGTPTAKIMRNIVQPVAALYEADIKQETKEITKIRSTGT